MTLVTLLLILIIYISLYNNCYEGRFSSSPYPSSFLITSKISFLMKFNFVILFFVGFLIHVSCGMPQSNPKIFVQNSILPAADQTELYLPLLKEKKVGLMG